MRTTIRTALAATTAVGLLAIPVAASAGGSSATTVTFTVDAAAASALAISQASGASSLDDGDLLSPANPGFDADTATSVTGTLPATTVTDERGTVLGSWSVSVVADGPWTSDTTPAQTVAATNARAYFDVLDQDALEVAAGALSGMALTGGEFAVGTSNLGSSYVLVSGQSLLGDGEITYTPAIDIDIPAGTPAGTYSAVVTQTLS